LPGKYGSDESKAAYLSVLSSLRATDSGSSLPVVASGRGPTVAELVAAFLQHAQIYYRKHGRSTGSYERFAQLIAPPLLARFHGRAAESITRADLRLVQDDLVARGLARSTVNDRIGYAKQIFKWGAENDLLPPETYARVASLKPLVAPISAKSSRLSLAKRQGFRARSSSQASARETSRPPPFRSLQVPQTKKRPPPRRPPPSKANRVETPKARRPPSRPPRAKSRTARKVAKRRRPSCRTLRSPLSFVLPAFGRSPFLVLQALGRSLFLVLQALGRSLFLALRALGSPRSLDKLSGAVVNIAELVRIRAHREERVRDAGSEPALKRPNAPEFVDVQPELNLRRRKPFDALPERVC